MSGPYKNPIPTVDVIIEMPGGIVPAIVLIRRANEPLGWALPGGFVDQGEPLWVAALREAKEETSLDVELTEQFHTYSDPRRDPRRHTLSTVFLARASGQPVAADDAAAVGVFGEADLPSLVFDHAAIVADYFRYRAGGPRPGPKR
ncbi:MAG: NUDIX hydrolase [Myxococcales bacterium]|nr:NUDIX hydrolase [Myxococcales bacterium]